MPEDTTAILPFAELLKLLPQTTQNLLNNALPGDSNVILPYPILVDLVKDPTKPVPPQLINNLLAFPKDLPGKNDIVISSDPGKPLVIKTVPHDDLSVRPANEGGTITLSPTANPIKIFAPDPILMAAAKDNPVKMSAVDPIPFRSPSSNPVTISAVDPIPFHSPGEEITATTPQKSTVFPPSADPVLISCPPAVPTTVTTPSGNLNVYAPSSNPVTVSAVDPIPFHAPSSNPVTITAPKPIECIGPSTTNPLNMINPFSCLAPSSNPIVVSTPSSVMSIGSQPGDRVSVTSKKPTSYYY